MNEFSAAEMNALYESARMNEYTMPALGRPLFVVDGSERSAEDTVLKLVRELGMRAIPFARMDVALSTFMRNPDGCAGLVTNVFMEPCAECGCLSGLDLAKRFSTFDKPVLFLTALDGERERALLGNIGYYLNKAQFSDTIAATANGERTVLRNFFNAAAAGAVPPVQDQQLAPE